MEFLNEFTPSGREKEAPYYEVYYIILIIDVTHN